MILYLDSSLISRALLSDEKDHQRALSLLHSDHALITGSCSQVEVSAALTRAARAHRGDQTALLAQFDQLTHPATGQITVVDVEQAEVELMANALVRRTGIRSLDAWHLACALLVREALAEPGERFAFATGDGEQAVVALDLGFSAAP